MIHTSCAYKQLDKLGQIRVSDLMVNYELDLELLDVDIRIRFVDLSIEDSKYKKYKMRSNKYLFKNNFLNILGQDDNYIRHTRGSKQRF